MKHINFLAICLLLSISIVSCDSNDEHIEEQTINTIVELPDSVKQKIISQDSVMNELITKIDTLTYELNSAKEKLAQVQRSITELEEPQSGTVIFIVVLFLFVVISILLYSHYNDKYKEQIGKIRQKIDVLQDSINLLSTQKQRSISQSPKDSLNQRAESRIQNLELNMKQVLQDINTVKGSANHVSTSSSPAPKETVFQKIGYAKVDTDIYFTTIYNSSQEGCVFKITFTSQTKGKFNIISLDKIQSRNDWQKKVECSGTTSIKEASSFSLEEEGICEKIDENSWKVTKPLRIRLQK